MKMLGAGLLSSLSSSTALPTIPTGAMVAVIQPLTQGVNLRTDGVAPLATTGRRINAGDTYELRGDLAAARLIQAAASATAQVTYYGNAPAA